MLNYLQESNQPMIESSNIGSAMYMTGSQNLEQLAGATLCGRCCKVELIKSLLIYPLL